MKICGYNLLPDSNIKPCQVIDQNGIPNYFLTIYGKNKFELGSNYRTMNNPLIIEIFDRGKKRFNNYIFYFVLFYFKMIHLFNLLSGYFLLMKHAPM